VSTWGQPAPPYHHDLGVFVRERLLHLLNKLVVYGLHVHLRVRAAAVNKWYG
jgi:hypothetical protein